MLSLTEQDSELFLLFLVIRQEFLHSLSGGLLHFLVTIFKPLSFWLDFLTPVFATCELVLVSFFDRHSFGRISSPVAVLACGFGFSVFLLVDPLLLSEFFDLFRRFLSF
jgi:hypothetical protein